MTEPVDIKTLVRAQPAIKEMEWGTYEQGKCLQNVEGRLVRLEARRTTVKS
jgi:hypothetical protein